MTRYHSPLSAIRAEALRLTCTCGAARTFTLDAVAEAMPGAILADLATTGCDDCGPAGRLAAIGIINPAPPVPEMEF